MLERKQYHLGCAARAAGSAHECAEPSAALYRVVEAIHEVAATYVGSCIESRGDGTELQQLAEDLVELRQAVNEHQAAIQKAVEGRAPWGEILERGAHLLTVVDKVLAR